MSKKRNRTAFFYVLPCLIVLGLFVYYPLVMNVTYSFQSFTLSAVTKEFVGFANFRKLFSDPIILTCLKNNNLYALISDIIQVGYFKLSHGKRVFKMAPFHHHLEMGGWTGHKWKEKEIFTLFSGISLLMSVISFIVVCRHFMGL